MILSLENNMSQLENLSTMVEDFHETFLQMVEDLGQKHRMGLFCLRRVKNRYKAMVGVEGKIDVDRRLMIS